MHDIKRSAVESICFLLNNFPCVAILGARQIGKTTLLKQVLPKAPFFDMEKQADFGRISRDPDFFLSQYENPIVIDEAQLLPELFSDLRVKIDTNRNKNGQYLISGSSSPELLTKISESLAGRIAIFELGGFSLEESWKKSGNPLYQYLAKKNTAKIISLKPQLSNMQLLESCLTGSYPEPFLKYRNEPKTFSLWMENYFRSYIERDVRGIFPGLNIDHYKRFVSMLAGTSGQILNASEFARSLNVSQPTVKSYFQIAHGTFVWRILPSYQKNINKRTIKMPKGHMRDSGLLNYVLKNRDTDLLQIHPLYGRIWETFIIEEIIKGFQNKLISTEPFFYRTSNQAEIDLILEGEFGTLPIKIKSGALTSKQSIMALKQFVEDHNLPFGIVINQARENIWLTKKILQLSAGCL